MMSAFLNVCSLFYASQWYDCNYLLECAPILIEPLTSNMRRVWDKKRLVLRGPVRKNRTNLGKGEEFDFFHIFMKNRLGYN